MRLVIYQSAAGPPIEVEADRVRVLCGHDHLELREQGGLVVRLEEHDGVLAMDLAVFPNSSNSVLLKGSLR